jgi:superfamily II DNA/RNA helicase
MLFSATFPNELLRLARAHTRNPAELATASGIKTVDAIRQEYISLDETERPLALIRLLEQSELTDIFLVFCERRTEVEQLMRRLERLSLPIKALHGGYDQAARFRVMSAFRTGEVKALIATDVASRGLDVQLVTHVVNFSVPRSVTDYTHRIGRTGRAGRDGHAITLVSHEHMRRWKQLLRDAPWGVERIDPPIGRAGFDRFRPGRRSGPGPQSREREERPGARDPEGRRREGRRSEGRDRDRDRSREPRGDGERERGRDQERRPERQPERLDAPVRLPENRPRRQRGPDDPPPRVQRSREPGGNSTDSTGEASPPRRERSRQASRPDEERPREPRSRSDELRPHPPRSRSSEKEEIRSSPPPRQGRREKLDDSGSDFGSGL